MCILSKLFGRRPKTAQNTVGSLPPERSFDSTVSGFGNSAEAAQGGVPKVKIELTHCRGERCMFCTIRCPKRAISFHGGRIELDENKCDLCGYCIEICPVGAISRDTK